MSREPGVPGEAVEGGREVLASICEHRVPANWTPRSTHSTSLGDVAYFRCACGAWLVLLDGDQLARSGQRNGAAQRGC